MTRSWPLFALATVVYAAPFAALAWVSTRPDTLTLTSPPPVEIWTEPTLKLSDRSQAVLVEYTVETGATLVAPQWSGVVTAVFLKPGDTVAHLDSVVAVDNIRRLAVFSDFPFYRTLKNRDEGPDVEALHGLLIELGFISKSPGVSFTNITGAAVKALRKSLGDPAPTSVFDPGLIIYIPRKEMVLGSLDLVVGAPAPGFGAVIATERGTIRDTTLSTIDGEELMLDPDHDWLLTIDDRSFVVNPEDSTLVDVSMLPEAQPSAALVGTVRLAEPIPVLAIPNSALVLDRSGQWCVFGRDASSEGIWIREITPLATRLGVTDVPVTQLPVAEILANPASALGITECPSN